MKKIHLIRHAKSSWKDASLADIDRPLNKRGIRTCQFMAQHISNAGCCFDHVFCSPAVRAQSTIELIAGAIPELKIKWRTEAELYTFDSGHLMEWFDSRDESISEIAIIGHNPAFTEVCNELSKGNIHNIPTCGYVQLAIPDGCLWGQISNVTAEIKAFLRPKELSA